MTVHKHAITGVNCPHPGMTVHKHVTIGVNCPHTAIAAHKHKLIITGVNYPHTGTFDCPQTRYYRLEHLLCPHVCAEEM